MVSIPEKDIDIDDIPLSFGKFKGKTPNELFKIEEYSYIVWLAENIEPSVVSDCIHEEAENEQELYDGPDEGDRWSIY